MSKLLPFVDTIEEARKDDSKTAEELEYRVSLMELQVYANHPLYSDFLEESSIDLEMKA